MHERVTCRETCEAWTHSNSMFQMEGLARIFSVDSRILKLTIYICRDNKLDWICTRSSCFLLIMTNCYLGFVLVSAFSWK